MPFLLISASLVVGCGSERSIVTPIVTEVETDGIRPDYSDISGVYDLTALVKSFDPAWGYDLCGYRYTAAVTLGGGAPPALAGAFSGLWVIGPAGDSVLVADRGLVDSKYFKAGDVIELHGSGTGPVTLTLVVEVVDPGVISGHFGIGGHIGGSFEATRR
jgi:hypothetical protein